MISKWLCLAVVLFPLAKVAGEERGQTAPEGSGPEQLTVEVTAPRAEAPETVQSYPAPISGWRFDPRVDVQSRAFAEAQGDLTLRGDVFENNAFSLGAVTLHDPQTGHYFAEIPVPPLMLGAPKVLTGVSNGLYGFDSAVGTLAYDWEEIQNQALAEAGLGDRGLNIQHAYLARQKLLNTPTGTLNFDLDLSHAESSGTRAHGDNYFKRYGARLQWDTPRSQTDVFVGEQYKQFSWPDMYALQELHDLLNTSGIESDALHTTLTTLNHLQNFSDGKLQFSAYYRRNRDDYEFDRYQPDLFNPFKHTSDAGGAGLAGQQGLGYGLSLNYAAEFLADHIQSTSLTFGPFSSRSSEKFTLLPEKRWTLTPDDILELKAGASWYDTNREAGRISPLASAAWIETLAPFSSNRYFLEYSTAYEAPTYTALSSSSSSGLFRGNPELGLQHSNNVEGGLDLNRKNQKLHLAGFYRRDLDFVDWIFDSSAAPYAARLADSLDEGVYGLEGFFTRHWSRLDLTAGYTYLDKHIDHSQAFPSYDGSFYALNYARERINLNLTYRPLEILAINYWNELRLQKDNPLRDSVGNFFYLSAIGVTFQPRFLSQFSLTFLVDNIWNENFEEVPGVPSRRRQFTALLAWHW